MNHPFAFLNLNARPTKPRSRGMTEIRGPYYTAFGKRYLADLLEIAGEYVDGLKFADGSFSLMPRHILRDIIDLCHEHQVLVSTGGFIERVLVQGAAAVEQYFSECHDLGFDVVEVSSGFVSVPADDLVELARAARRAGMKVKPEVTFQFGAGGGTPADQLNAERTQVVTHATDLARRYLDTGADLVMVESEGVTENVHEWRIDAVDQLIAQIGLDKLMFEAADPRVFGWYVKTYGADVNLFVDHSQIVQLECLRSGVWGTNDLWGRVLRYRPAAVAVEESWGAPSEPPSASEEATTGFLTELEHTAPGTAPTEGGE